MLPIVMCAAAMVLDLGHFYVTQAINQRIADQSALAAAIAYGQSSNNFTTASAAASSLATANGAGTSTVATSLTTVPGNTSETAIKVVVTSSVTLTFGAMFYGSSSVSVGATAYAAIQPSYPCFIALTTGGGGVSLMDGAKVTATYCNIGSNASVSVSDATLSATSIYAVGSISSSNSGTITTSGGQHSGASAQTDPYASSGVFSRISTVANETAPSFPSSTVGSAPSGTTNLPCTGSTLTVPSGSWGMVSASSTCTITLSGGSETDIGSYGGITISGSGTVTLNFAAGTYKINGIYLSGSAKVIMNVTGTVIFEIWNGINLASGSSSQLTVNGPATYYVQGGITTYSPKSLTFTNGSSSSTSTFVVTGGINIASGTATFPNGTYTILGPSSAGIAVSGGSTSATFGNGSFIISGNYDGIQIGSSSTLVIGSELSSSSLFEVICTNSGCSSQYPSYYGITTGGSSSLTIGSFSNIDVNGAFSVSSSLSIGASTVTVNGEFSACSSGGGSLLGSGVSVVASGSICFGQGFSTIDFTAPSTLTSSSEGGTPTIALASESTSTSIIWGGATNTEVVGAVYIPKASLSIYGGGNLNGAGGCLQIIAGSMSWTQGAVTTTNCSALGGSFGSVVLAQ